jgi:predicted O-methyltransferase YrrM
MAFKFWWPRSEVSAPPAPAPPAPAESPHADDGSLAVVPIEDIACPTIDLHRGGDPVRAILQAPEFAETKRFFAEGPSSMRSLLSDTAQALLYAVIRNLRPEHVVEIGTYKAGTSEGLARAVHANGLGIVHTVSPFDADHFAAISVRWPPELQHAVRYHCVDSMAFFMEVDKKGIRPGVVLIDGHHDYEFASFDIQATARRLLPGGFIFIDNVSQAGPYFAARDFLARHPDWVDCGEASAAPDETKAFVPARSSIPYTDLIVLRAPSLRTVGKRPQTFGDMPWTSAHVHGLKLSLANPSQAGTLHVQCVLRGFSETRVIEVVGDGSRTISAGEKEIDIALSNPIGTDGPYDRYSLEPWLAWLGDAPLSLDAVPLPY